jgi:hypothetical protein
VLITAVDAHTGEPVVFDRHSGVDWWTPSPPAVPTASVSLPTASATADTSTAATDATRTPIWRPDTGGCWCCHHLAAEHGTPLDWGMQLAAQVDELRARGSRVETVFPDSDSRDAFGSQSDGSVDASARRSSRLRPRQSPCRAAHRILALTPSKSVDSVGVTTPAHASEADDLGSFVPRPKAPLGLLRSAHPKVI